MHDDFAILAAIAANPSHAYQVLDHLQGLGQPTSRSTLYRRIDALITQGLVVATGTRTDGGHSRRELALTSAGNGVLARDVPEVLRTHPLESPLFALALGCATATDTEGLPDLLKPLMANAARRLTAEERSLNASSRDAGDWQQVARERRIAHLQADIAWLQSILGRRSVPGATESAHHSRTA
jgi:DNA-binding PadR family transcriptional regulator